MKRLFFLSILVVLVACSSGIKKHVIESFESGAPRQISFYKMMDNDSLLVREEWYYEDSILRMEGDYRNGKKSGEWKAYYADGTVWSEGEFEDGLSNGARKVYHENGNIYYSGFYTEDKRTGHWEFYNIKGEKIKEIDY